MRSAYKLAISFFIAATLFLLGVGGVSKFYVSSEPLSVAVQSSYLYVLGSRAYVYLTLVSRERVIVVNVTLVDDDGRVVSVEGFEGLRLDRGERVSVRGSVEGSFGARAVYRVYVFYRVDSGVYGASGVRVVSADVVLR